MLIAMVTTDDPAGTAIKFAHAVNRTTSHRCRVITTEENRYGAGWPRDLHVPAMRTFDEAADLLERADVLHFHMTADESLLVGPHRVSNLARTRKFVHHHHGEPAFRADPRSFAEREMALRRSALVSTPDLWAMYPEATWMPNCVPIHDVLYLPMAHRNGHNGPATVVGHSPTRRDLKNTVDFLEAAAGVPSVQPLLMENVSNEQCLRMKRRCDLFFDHMQGYYGVSSLEALSQGVPTIAGLDDWNVRCLRDFAGGGELPWIIARDREGLRRALSGGKREESGGRSRAFMERHWTEARIASKLVSFYESL